MLLGSGDGTFQGARRFATGAVRPLSIASADLTGDGVPDLVTANQFSYNVSVLVGNSDPVSFSARVARGTGGWNAELRIPDALFGGWHHAAGIIMSHFAVDGGALSFNWPTSGDPNGPATWAQAQLGLLPVLANQAPVGYAAANQILQLDAPQLVFLDGTGTRDPDGDKLNLQWAQVTGPAVLLSDADKPISSFQADPVTRPIERLFRLIINDGEAVTEAETTITILPPEGRALPTAPLFRRGEVNGDGELDVSDVITTLIRLFASPEAFACSDAADVNDSGSADISDAVYSLHFLFLGGPAPLPPFEICGMDPTEDTLDCVSFSGCQ